MSLRHSEANLRMPTITLPSWLIDFAPHTPRLNVHYNQTRQESRTWTRGYNFFSEERQGSYEKENSELLTALSFPYFGYEVIRLSCDLTNILFVVDVTTDHQSLDDARETCDLVRLGAHHPSGEHNSAFSSIMADFMTRYDRISKPNSRRRFLSHLDACLDTVVTQTSLRHHGKVIASIEQLRIERRDNSAIKLCFDILELGLGMDLPHTGQGPPAWLAGGNLLAFQHTTHHHNTKEFMDIYLAAVDLVWISNEVYSYSMEKSIGHHEYNLITLYMKHHQLDLHGAFDQVDREFRRIWAELQVQPSALSSFGIPELDTDISRFMDGLIQWIEGMLQ
ncbi:hypothetical protein ONZ45_g19163 [Pleurotus djamor]|nr:hypothetical protein ONZ45_g19163 [Pleurotus djamor]